MPKISGLDKLTRAVSDAKKAFAAIDGEIGAVTFNPNDPASIQSAIASMEAMIDERVGQYVSNPFVAPMIPEMKEKYRQAILERAAKARLGQRDST